MNHRTLTTTGNGQTGEQWAAWDPKVCRTLQDPRKGSRSLREPAKVLGSQSRTQNPLTNLLVPNSTAFAEGIPFITEIPF